MNEYLNRKAALNDIPFLIEVVIAALKGNSDKLGLSTLFDLPEDRIKKIIGSMFEHAIDGCEFSISSFLITEYNDKPVAAIGGWIEGLHHKIPSSILKSNLIIDCYPKESITFALAKLENMFEMLIKRESLSLQIEYVYVKEDHRGKNLAEDLMQQHITNALTLYPGLKKVQIQLFRNNTAATRLYNKCGFHIAKVFKSSKPNILDYLPDAEILLMEIDIK